jgi:GxxExxY protein
MDVSQDFSLSHRVIGLAMEVHSQLGPGLLESAYEECLCLELARAEIAYRRQMPLPIKYKGLKLDLEYRMDVVIEQRLIIEIKVVERILPAHKAQLLTYLRLSGYPTGLLMNFHTAVLRDGIHRVALSRQTSASPRLCVETT